MKTNILDILRAAANQEKAEQMKAYMRNQFEFLGIQTPQRKKLCQSFLREQKTLDWDFVNKCWDLPEREFQYLAINCLSKLKALLSPVDIPNMRQLITTKSWWDSVDGLDVIVGDIALRYPELDNTLLEWSTDENIWLRRTAIDHQLLRKLKTNTALLEQIIINNFNQDEFFINKAIGWSLREFSKTDPDWVRNFINKYKSRMATLSIREASKYL
jgi:3-methyladenine DNA glycosylase AlkD